MRCATPGVVEWGGAVLLFLSSALFGCADPGKTPPTALQPPQTSPEEMARFQAEVRKVWEKRRDRNKAIGEMGIEALVKELQEESRRQVESFSSLPFQEVLKRKEAATGPLKAALDRAIKEKEPFLLGLLALRRIDLERYKTLELKDRIEILTRALKESKLFNAWGLPHRTWEEAARVLIAEGIAEREAGGASVLAALRPLLEDRERAPVRGSFEAHESERYKYRVCDYALGLYLAIERPGEKSELHPDPGVRDKAIAVVLSRPAKDR